MKKRETATINSFVMMTLFVLGLIQWSSGESTPCTVKKRSITSENSDGDSLMNERSTCTEYTENNSPLTTCPTPTIYDMLSQKQQGQQAQRAHEKLQLTSHKSKSSSRKCTNMTNSVVCENLDGHFLTDVQTENITVIIIQNSKLMNLSKGDFSKFTNVEVIIIDGCDVPSTVLNYALSPKQLKVFEVRNSNITENYFTALRQRRSLKKLSMTGNKIVLIKNGIFDNLSRLEEIDLSNNQITPTETDVFKYLFDLRALDLSRNRVSDDFDLALKATCEQLTPLVFTCPTPATNGRGSLSTGVVGVVFLLHLMCILPC